MTRLPLFIFSFLLLHLIPQEQIKNSVAEPFRFHDIWLDMPMAEFRSVHRAPKIEKNGPSNTPLPGEAGCSKQAGGSEEGVLQNAANEITWCYYKEEYLDVKLRISAAFVGGKLGLIEVEPPTDSSGCFEPPSANAPNSEKYFHSTLCENYPALTQALTQSLGHPTRIVSPNENLKSFLVERWENESSVAEFQHRMCGPWDGTKRGWGRAIEEVLGGKYCAGSDVLSSCQPVMLYIRKDLGRRLAVHLTTSSD